MQVKFRAGAVLCRADGQPMYTCPLCKRGKTMHNVRLLLQNTGKERTWRVTLSLLCPQCGQETILPLKRTFADFQQAAEYVRVVKEGNNE